MILRYLQKQGVQDIWIANRTVAKADALANGSNVQAMALADLPQHLAKADIVITATAAPLPIVGKGLIERALKIRRHRPMLFIDLAVPRNIEPEAAQLPDVYLYSLDDLQKIITENQRDRQLAAEQAEGIITLHVERFMRWLSSLDAVGTIRVFRNKINTIRDQELAKALRSLQLGYSPDEVLRKLAHNLTNKVLHTPTIAIREASNNKQMELLACARSLFALE
jgi:glutamyl-tRNA reductase